MSCNPSIGGVGKGHLVRELDVFDGLMGGRTDRAAIHRRMLNRSKGAAVHGPRVQADRSLYRSVIADFIAQSGAEVVVGEALRMRIDGGRITGVETSVGTFECRALVIATGTFLDARIFVGEEVREGGRRDEKASCRSAVNCARSAWGRGGSRRHERGLDGRTIDWARLEDQPSAPTPGTCRRWHGAAPPQLRCAIARTKVRTHSHHPLGVRPFALVAGAIEGRGPATVRRSRTRSSASATARVTNLSRARGTRRPTVYPNGISTSLPADVQLNFVRRSRPRARRDCAARVCGSSMSSSTTR